MEGIERIKGIKTMRLYELIKEGKTSAIELAKELGTSPANVRRLKVRLREYGVIFGERKEVTTKKLGCPTCEGSDCPGMVRQKTDDGIRYKRCPDCNPS